MKTQPNFLNYPFPPAPPQIVGEDEDLFDDDELNEGKGVSSAFMETALLEKIAYKLVLLTDITVQKSGREEVDENIQQYTAATVIIAKKEEIEEQEEELRDEEYLKHHRVALMQAGKKKFRTLKLTGNRRPAHRRSESNNLP